ncbi:hypothetical protein TPHA_0E00370 [Tetrapisispora phaffii CBS 4417]|uniref:triacylglycerol lipase n=1 Tax=Tetrapisispora phaffii (strain ATCC 24235 / CBS 4417 / NBRC 1672 / NRRL Y-8282 / UCD 70-5) TaxID=1071381 RepID=G8BTA5_TETPH|nr:hypothetical protein TPHA_0E00370 [Tetrapisispora phaffii CBS 4417]CCE63133.1 hypothetical protein TPHA_0E00370 [Tetrapisispora phaffii CBS 4417]
MLFVKISVITIWLLRKSQAFQLQGTLKYYDSAEKFRLNYNGNAKEEYDGVDVNTETDHGNYLDNNSGYDDDGETGLENVYDGLEESLSEQKEVYNENFETSTSRNEDYKNVKISQDFYDRLVYFSKVCAMTSCISDNLIKENKTFAEGGCPGHLKFCKDPIDNPTYTRTRIEMVLSADKGELGTGYVIVDHKRKVVIIAFRGSSTRQDWFSDFQIYPVDYEPASLVAYNKLVNKRIIPECHNCKIHRGFYRFKETLGPLFLDKIEAIFNKYPDYRAVVSGHSLGAAMASITGIELKLRGYNPIVLTYATPRMFNTEMREWIDTIFSTDQIHYTSVSKGVVDYNHCDKGGYFRVVHNQDYIPMVPPFYEAAGLELFINKIELPHTIDDVEYRGHKKTYFEDITKLNTVNHVEDWLHTYEHRAYFILIEGCHNI